MREHAGVAIDVGDLALDRGGCTITGIEGEGAEFLGERRDFDAGRTNGARADGENGLFAGNGIDEFEFLFGQEGGLEQSRASVTRSASGIKAAPRDRGAR
jgi:hypothetical protein